MKYVKLIEIVFYWGKKVVNEEEEREEKKVFFLKNSFINMLGC